MTQANQGLGEQALNKAAEIGLSSQLDEVEELDVDIKTDPLHWYRAKWMRSQLMAKVW